MGESRVGEAEPYFGPVGRSGFILTSKQLWERGFPKRLRAKKSSLEISYIFIAPMWNDIC